jgi:hypothetical protein
VAEEKEENNYMTPEGKSIVYKAKLMDEVCSKNDLT